MLRIAVCDDSSFIRGITKKSLVKYSFQNNIDVEIDEYETGELLLQAEKSGEKQHQLIFIDYEFEEKGENGIAIISEFRKFNKNTKVIFLSSYPQVVFQSFEVEAFRFLVKPLEEDKLFKAMDDFMASIAEERVLTIRVEGENFFYQESIISHIEGCGKNCILHFSDNRRAVVSNETISSVEDRLSKEDFFRCHKSFLVNMRHVESYSHTDITLSTGETILISRNKYKYFGEALADYISGKRGI
ncbi:MAG: response regulator transcription factor [Lachnospiraceae bacterium]|nr:response regulator transcription factor [Lachnospiraceae bacterium]